MKKYVALKLTMSILLLFFQGWNPGLGIFCGKATIGYPLDHAVLASEVLIFWSWHNLQTRVKVARECSSALHQPCLGNLGAGIEHLVHPSVLGSENGQAIFQLVKVESAGIVALIRNIFLARNIGKWTFQRCNIQFQQLLNVVSSNIRGFCIMEEVCLQRNYKSEQENTLFIESEFHAADCPLQCVPTLATRLTRMMTKLWDKTLLNWHLYNLCYHIHPYIDIHTNVSV